MRWLLPLLLLLPTSACYQADAPAFPTEASQPAAPESSATTEGEREHPASASSAPTTEPQNSDDIRVDASPGAQQRRQEAILAVLKRLGSDQRGRPKGLRTGAGGWRPAELDKLNELLRAACSGGPSPCAAAVQAVAAAELPADESWYLAGTFLGPGRPHAEFGMVQLLPPLLEHEDGAVRDRAFRMATAVGMCRRGDPDSLSRRASAFPMQAEAGAPVWLLVEMPSPCPRITGQAKGPDGSGRVDAVVQLDCGPDAPTPLGPTEVPRATRAVWVHKIPALPASGLQLVLDHSDGPLLEFRPRPVPDTPR